MSDYRPKWDFTELTEAEFRRVYQHGMVVEVTAKRQFTGADTSVDWLDAKSSEGKIIRLPQGYKEAFEFVGYSTMPGLFGLTYLGKRMAARIKQIDAWEKQNKEDREQYEKLKRKFDGGKDE